MADNVLFAFEGLGADLADEEPLVTVDVLLVDLQVAAVGEGLLAGLTPINHLGLLSVVCTGEEQQVAASTQSPMVCLLQCMTIA